MRTGGTGRGSRPPKQRSGPCAVSRIPRYPGLRSARARTPAPGPGPRAGAKNPEVAGSRRLGLEPFEPVTRRRPCGAGRHGEDRLVVRACRHHQRGQTGCLKFWYGRYWAGGSVCGSVGERGPDGRRVWAILAGRVGLRC